MSEKLTQDEFERGYAERSGMSIEEFRAWRIGLPCGCEDESCPGWAAVSRDPDSINEHLDFYAPDAPRLGIVGKFRELGFVRSHSSPDGELGELSEHPGGREKHR